MAGVAGVVAATALRSRRGARPGTGWAMWRRRRQHAPRPAARGGAAWVRRAWLRRGRCRWAQGRRGGDCAQPCDAVAAAAAAAVEGGRGRGMVTRMGWQRRRAAAAKAAAAAAAALARAARTATAPMARQLRGEREAGGAACRVAAEASRSRGHGRPKHSPGLCGGSARRRPPRLPTWTTAAMRGQAAARWGRGAPRGGCDGDGVVAVPRWGHARHPRRGKSRLRRWRPLCGSPLQTPAPSPHPPRALPHRRSQPQERSRQRPAAWPPQSHGGRRGGATRRRHHARVVAHRAAPGCAHATRRRDASVGRPRWPYRSFGASRRMRRARGATPAPAPARPNDGMPWKATSAPRAPPPRLAVGRSQRRGGPCAFVAMPQQTPLDPGTEPQIEVRPRRALWQSSVRLCSGPHASS